MIIWGANLSRYYTVPYYYIYILRVILASYINILIYIFPIVTYCLLYPIVYNQSHAHNVHTASSSRRTRTLSRNLTTAQIRPSQTCPHTCEKHPRRKATSSRATPSLFRTSAFCRPRLRRTFTKTYRYSQFGRQWKAPDLLQR